MASAMALAGVLGKLTVSNQCRAFCFTVTGVAAGRQQRWLEQRGSRETLREVASENDLDVRAYRQKEGSQRLDCEDKDSFNQRFEIGQVARLGRERRWEEALVVFESIADPCTVLHAAAADACAKSQKVALAQRIFDEMPSKSLPAYNSLINLYGRLGRLDKLEALLAGMRSASFTPNTATYSSLITAHSEVGDLDSALQAFEDMNTAGVLPNSVSYMVIITACAKVSNESRASEMLARMISSGLKPNVGHFTGVITSCARSGDEKRAAEVFAELRRSSLKPDVVAYTSLMCCFHGPDALSKADKVLAEMQADGIKPNATTYSELLRTAMRSRATERFEGLLAEMEKEGIPRSQKVQMRIRQMRKQQAEPPSLPQGWRETLDPATVQPYFWREADPAGSVTWERPC